VGTGHRKKASGEGLRKKKSKALEKAAGKGKTNKLIRWLNGGGRGAWGEEKMARRV